MDQVRSFGLYAVPRQGVGAGLLSCAGIVWDRFSGLVRPGPGVEAGL